MKNTYFRFSLKWNSKFNRCIYTNLTLHLAPNRTDSQLSHQQSLISSTMYIPLSKVDIPIGTLVFPPKFERIYNISPTHVTWLAHPTVFGSIKWIILGNGHKLWRVSISSFILTLFIFSSLRPSCLFIILFSSSEHDSKTFGTLSNEYSYRINIRTQIPHGIQ
jgi:hypothetical protein